MADRKGREGEHVLVAGAPPRGWTLSVASQYIIRLLQIHGFVVVPATVWG